MLDVLWQGLLGSKIYLLHIVEFQKRDLPRTLRVEPQPQTTNEIDEVVGAEVPSESDDSEDQWYRELVERYMKHHHSPACLDNNGVC